MTVNKEESTGHIVVDEAYLLVSLNRKVLLWVSPVVLIFPMF